jgi:hypothetical protein
MATTCAAEVGAAQAVPPSVVVQYGQMLRRTSSRHLLAAAVDNGDEGGYSLQPDVLASLSLDTTTDTDTTTTRTRTRFLSSTTWSNHHQTYGGSNSSSQSQQQTAVDNRGRTVLTFLYLCILGLCFLTPILYYCRLYFEERNARRLRELETAAFEQSSQQQALGGVGGLGAHHHHHHHTLLHHHMLNSNNNSHNREEARAVRRKYVEERRARILQLFEPVRLVRTYT